jgi:hypothetical protein
MCSDRYSLFVSCGCAGLYGHLVGVPAYTATPDQQLACIVMVWLLYCSHKAKIPYI